jgi:putative spermidine/putrescine transport system permease protein
MMELAPTRSFRITTFGAWLAILFLTLPFVVVFPVSLTPNRYLSLPDGQWSLRHYATLIDDPTWLLSIRDSLIVALGSTLMALLLGTMTALSCWRLSSRLSEAVRMAMLAPMIVPSIVHALGFYQVWAKLGLLDTYLGVIIAHAMKATPYVVISVSAALANVDFWLEQAARNLGATTLQALRKVILPAAKPGLIAGAVFAFALSWDELVVNLFISSRGVYTLPRKIWDGIQDNVNPAIAAVASLLITLTIAAMILRTLLARRRVRLAALPTEP